MESNDKTTGILAELKKLLFGEEVAPIVETVIAEATEYKLEDGTSIMVSALEVGGEVKISDAPALAGTHKLEDGSSIVLDEAGIITEVIPKAEDDPAEETGPLDTPEQMLAATAKFATGTPEERLANLEIIAKALMEYSFGWQMREAQDKAIREEAIATYKNNFEAAEKKIEKLEGVNKQMFELITLMTKEPAANPPGNEEKKKSEFSKKDAKKAGLDKYAEAAQKLKEQA